MGFADQVEEVENREEEKEDPLDCQEGKVCQTEYARPEQEDRGAYDEIIPGTAACYPVAVGRGAPRGASPLHEGPDQYVYEKCPQNGEEVPEIIQVGYQLRVP